MTRINTPLLDEQAKAALEKRFRTDKSHVTSPRKVEQLKVEKTGN